LAPGEEFVLSASSNADKYPIDAPVHGEPMFRTIASLMTAATVFWHAVAGCCAHHGHASEVPPPASKSAPEEKTFEVPHRCGCCKHKAPASVANPRAEESAAGDPSSKSTPPVKTPPASPCDGEKCSFAVAKIVSASDPESGLCGFEYPARNTVSLAGDAKPVDVVNGADIKPPPLRRHLALNVLLI